MMPHRDPYHLYRLDSAKLLGLLTVRVQDTAAPYSSLQGRGGEEEEEEHGGALQEEYGGGVTKVLGAWCWCGRKVELVWRS